MKEDREKADLVVHLVGENELERAHVRQVLETVTEPRLELMDFAPDSPTHHPAKPDAVLVQIEENPALGLAYLNRLSERPNKPFLVGLLRDEAAAMMRQVLHAGADELLPVPLDANEAMLLFLKLKERDQSGKPASKIGKIYSVAGLAGGVGMSTIAANLGLAMRYELGRRVAIVDLDLQNGGFALKMHLNPEQTIMPLLERYRRLDSISSGIFAIILVATLVVLGSGRRDGDRSRAKEMLARVTTDSEDELAMQLLRADPRGRSRQGLAFSSLYALRPIARLEESLCQAGIYLHVSELMLLVVVLCGVGCGLGVLLTGDAALSVGSGVIAALLPLVYVRWRRGRTAQGFSTTAAGRSRLDEIATRGWAYAHAWSASPR